jgi:uncharacterized flavoprotein (TIGR03862 family)
MKLIFVPVNRHQNQILDSRPDLPVVVIGAGPSGLMVADLLSQSGIKVLLIDAMPSPGRKFLMAGRGGLNLTHSEQLSGFEMRYRPDPLWMAPYLANFTPSMTRQFMDELGAETFVGSSGRVFPRAMKSSPLLRSWLSRLKSQGVEASWATRFIKFQNHNHLIVKQKEALETIAFSYCVLAVGGASWPRLGSDGAWAVELEKMGLAIKSFEPSNMGVIIDDYDTWLEGFKGEPLKSISIRFQNLEIKGELMITKNGLEGGAIYALSCDLREALKTSKPIITLDLKPQVSAQKLQEKLDKYGPKTSLSNRLRKGARLSESAIALVIHAYFQQPQIELSTLIKNVPFSIKSVHGLEKAISSAGGVKTSELNPDLSLKIAPHIFCVGEMIDWEAPTGGYLLQGCFSTAYACAQSLVYQQKSVNKS